MGRKKKEEQNKKKQKIQKKEIHKQENKETKLSRQNMKDTIKQLCSGNDSKLKVVSAIISVTSVAFLYIFKVCAYIYEMGAYARWNIPIMYIEVEYKHVLWKFILAVVTAITFYILSFVYCSLYKNSKKLGRGFLLLLVPGGIFSYLIGYSIMHSSISETLLAIKLEWRMVIENVVLLSIAAYPLLFCVWGLITPINDTKSKKSENEGRKFRKKNEKYDHDKQEANHLLQWKICRYINRNVIGFIYLLIAVAGFVYIIYSNGKNSFDERETVEIITQEGQDYIVVGKTEKQWILKPCKVENNKILVSQNNFRITGDSTITVRVFMLEGKVKDQIMFDSRL